MQPLLGSLNSAHLPRTRPSLQCNHQGSVWKMSSVRRVALLAVVSLFLLITHLPSANTSPVQIEEFGRAKKVEHGKLGAVASESSICSHHGAEMLKNGGNAADAVSDIRAMIQVWMEVLTVYLDGCDGSVCRSCR